MRLYALLVVSLLIAGILAIVVGSGDLADPELRDTFLKLRGFRLAAAFLAGAALAVGEVQLQRLGQHVVDDVLRLFAQLPNLVFPVDCVFF